MGQVKRREGAGECTDTSVAGYVVVCLPTQSSFVGRVVRLRAGGEHGGGSVMACVGDGYYPVLVGRDRDGKVRDNRWRWWW